MSKMKDDKTGILLYSAANIAYHFFSVDFLVNKALPNLKHLPLHVAVKKIPFVNDKGQTTTVLIFLSAVCSSSYPSLSHFLLYRSRSFSQPEKENGIKLELFIFDTFLFAENMVCFAVSRQGQFTAVKNAEGKPGDKIVPDSPASARKVVYLVSLPCSVFLGQSVCIDLCVSFFPFLFVFQDVSEYHKALIEKAGGLVKAPSACFSLFFSLPCLSLTPYPVLLIRFWQRRRRFV
jgi:hypothetical protein